MINITTNNGKFRNHHRTVFFIATIFFGSLFSACEKETTVVIAYEQEITAAMKTAEESGKFLCVVLSTPDCPPCTQYIQYLGEVYKNLADKIFFNIIDVSLPENKWYTQWLCTGSSPTTCIFSPSGELKAVVPGAAAVSLQCIGAVIANGDTKCAEYLYRHPSFDKTESMHLLNTLLSCKQNLAAGKDISEEIAPCLGSSTYPYAVYLKCLNEEKQGRHDEAVRRAQQLLTFNSTLYLRAYSDLFTEVKTIINPHYTPENDAVLSVNKELRLENCRMHQPTPFSLTVTNTGKSPLTIRDIGLSCTCLKLLSEKQQHLLPGQSTKIEVVFTPDVQGEVYREIAFFSDAANSLERVRVTAVVE